MSIKVAKRLVVVNVSPSGNLNNDLFLRVLLQLRNTLDPDCDMSPAEIDFGRPLRDIFSFISLLSKFTNRSKRRLWHEAWRAKEGTLCTRAKGNNAELRSNTRPLDILHCGDRVFPQNQAGNHSPFGIKLSLLLRPWVVMYMPSR